MLDLHMCICLLLVLFCICLLLDVAKNNLKGGKAHWKAEKICLINELKKYVEEKETGLGEKAAILEEKEAIFIHAQGKEIELDGLLIADQEKVACLEAELPNMKALTNESLNKVFVVEAGNKELELIMSLKQLAYLVINYIHLVVPHPMIISHVVEVQPNSLQ
nr:hypothetical protein [Tanacetum cinerariifolium]